MFNANTSCHVLSQTRVDYNILSLTSAIKVQLPLNPERHYEKPDMKRKLHSTSSNLNYTVPYNKNNTFGDGLSSFFVPLVWK